MPNPQLRTRGAGQPTPWWIRSGLPILWLLASLIAVLVLETSRFVSSFVPVAILVLILWLAITVRDESRGIGWVVLGIVLIPVSGIVAAALREESGRIPITGLPLVLLSMTLLAYVLALVLLDFWAVRWTQRAGGEAAHGTVLAIARLGLAVHVLAPCFSLYFYVLRLDGMNEDVFNAVFRFVLFMIVYGPVTASLMVPQTTSRIQAFLALGIPVTFALAKVWTVGVDGLYGFLLLVAVVNVLAVWIALVGLALRSFFVKTHRPEAWGFVVPALAGTALSVWLSWGVLRRLGEELLRIENLNLVEVLAWIVIPAGMVAADVLWGGAPSPFYRLRPATSSSED